MPVFSLLRFACRRNKKEKAYFEKNMPFPVGKIPG
jgi:hypothetical protein